MPDITPLLQIHPTSGVPIYRQLLDQIRALVTSGRIEPGTMLPSVRQLASQLEVNMMTVSKTYSRLESDGLVERVRGTGMRVKASRETGQLVHRLEELQPLVESLAARAKQLNLTSAEVVRLVKKTMSSASPNSKPGS